MDESTDITAQAQLLIFGRFLKENSVTEKLLIGISLDTTTGGEDIFYVVDKFFIENNLDWSKVTECSMDGVPSLMGQNIGVMQVVISTINYVKAWDLTSRIFKQLCISENSNHYTLLMHTAVRWLS